MTKAPTTIRWRVFIILAIGSFSSYFLRSNLSISAPTMISDLGLNEIQWGWIMASFAAGYAIFQFPGGIMGDKFGPRKALTIIAVLWGVFTILTALVPGPDAVSISLVIGGMMAVRFLVGAVHAPIFPVQNCAISRWFPVGGWALPLGLSSAGLTLGYAVAAPILAWLTVQFGWRVSFLIIAPVGFIAAGFWWWYSRDNPADHPSINQAELDIIRAKQLPEVEELPPPPGWIRILKNRDILLLMISYSLMNFVFWEVFTWFPYYWESVRGYSTQDAGWVVSSQWIAGAAGAAIGGWFCDKLCKVIGLRWGCRWPIIIGMVISGVLLIGGAYQSNVMIAVVMLSMCFFFNQMTEGTYWATSIAIGGQFSGAAGGLMNTGANAVGVVNALIVPWFAAQFGWTFAVASGGIFAFVGAVLLLFVRADRPMILEALATEG